MTHAQFAQGWKLLILQPWGWRYRSLTDQGQPTEESRAQLEFYFQKLQWGHEKAWMKVADLYAQGHEWPSVTELKRALQSMQGQFVKGLTDGRADRYEPIPEELRERFTRIGKGLGNVE